MSGERIGVLCSLLSGSAASTAEASVEPLRPEWVDPEAGLAVWQALRAAGEDAVLLREGGALDLTLRAERITVVLPAARGPALREGGARGLLELLGVPYPGSDALTTALALDARRSRQVLRQLNLPTPASYNLDAGALAQGSALEELLSRQRSFGYPVVVRARHDDPRCPPRRARDEAELMAALRAAAAEQAELLVERHGAGRVCSVALLDGALLGIGASAGPPLSEERRRGVVELAQRASQGLGCVGPVQVDLLVSERDNESVLAVDPRPALSPGGLFGQAAAERGVSFAELVARWLRGATLRGRPRGRLSALAPTPLAA